MIKKINKFFPIIGAVVFLYLLTRLDFSLIKSIFFQINYFYFLIAFIILIPFYLMKVYRWKLIMKIQGINYSFKNSVLVHSIGIFWGVITPAKSGDLIKALYLKKDGHSWGKSFFNVFLDRLLDIGFLIIFGYLSLFLFFNLFQKTIFNFSILLAVLIIVSFFLIKNRNYERIFRKIFYKFVPENHQTSWKLNYQDFINEIKRYKIKDYLKIILITLLSWFLFYLIVYFLALGVNIKEVPFWVYPAAVTLASLASMLPISFSGIGTRDVVFILIFSQFGIIFEKTITLSFMVLLSFVAVALFGLICSFFKPLNRSIQ